MDENKILDKYSHYIPLNHIIDDVQRIADNRKKIAKRLGTASPREEEIIKHFFANRKINKLEECYIDLGRILTLRKKIGGQIVLNHPGKFKRIDKDFIARLKKLKYHFVDPEEGDLACGYRGVGRMADISKIADKISSVCKKS